MYYDKSEFDEARLFERSVYLNDEQKSERLFQKLDEIEEICSSSIQPTEKWNKLRPYVMWLTGKILLLFRIFFR